LFFSGILFIFFIKFNFYSVNLSIFLGIDIISYGLLILRVWICALMLLSREIIFKTKNYIIFFLLLVIFLLLILFLTFRTMNIFLFYLFFERRLIPTLFLILG
jgi:NADH-ubiquinone oxidoreductase chain 4